MGTIFDNVTVENTLNVENVEVNNINVQNITVNNNDLVIDVSNKVDKIAGKGLSTEDYTTLEKNNLALLYDFYDKTGLSGVVSGGNISLTGGVNFTISAGTGYIRDGQNKLVLFSWNSINGTITTSGDNFLYIDISGNIIYSNTKNNYNDIFIGYITTNVTNTAVLGFNNNKFPVVQYPAKVFDFIQSTIGTIVDYGFEVYASGLTVGCSGGVLFSSLNKYTFPAKTTFRKFYKDNTNAYFENTNNPNTVDNSYYNNVSLVGTNALVPMTSGYYKKDCVFISTAGNLFYQYGTTEYLELEHAYAANPPDVNMASENVTVLAHIIVQEGNPNIVAVIDVRSSFERIWSGHYFRDLITTVNHHQIQGLGEDDHTQYHNDARGDIRYYKKTELDAGTLDTRYYTETEVNSLLANKANAVHTHVAADITDLSKTSVGLSNVQNVDTTNASNISSGTLPTARLSTNLQEISAITKSNGDVISVVGGVYSARTPAQLKSDLSLNNVANVDTSDASNISSGTLSDNRLSTNLSQIGGLSFNTNDIIQFNGINLTNVSLNSFKTSLSLTKNDVGLSNIQNVDNTNASNITSGTLSNARLSSNLSQLGGLTFNANDFVQYNGATLTNITPTALKTSLSLNKTDVGLGNVTNSLQVINAGNAVSFATGLNASKPTAGTNGRLYGSTDQGIIYFDNGISWNAQLPSYTGDVTSSVGGTTLTLATVNSNIGTFNNITVNGKGLVTAASNIAYLTANQNITVSGDISGSGTTSLALTLPTINSNVGTFGGSASVPVINVNGKGLVTSVSTAAITPTSIGLGNVTNSLQVINDGTAVSFASGTNATRSAAGTNGRFYYSTDQGIVSFDNGTTWGNILPAYTGDVTSSQGGTALTLATVNSNIGTFNNVTVNGKGLVTAASNANYLVDPANNGILVRTAQNTTGWRAIDVTPNQLAITNGDGVAGNPTISIASNPVLPGTGSVTLPIGSTAQRDIPTNGQLRWNNTLGYAEISDTGVYRPIGRVAQIITGTIPQTTGTTILPYDNTVPQSTEGFQIWTASITPYYTTSTIIVFYSVFAESSVATAIVSSTLFKGTTLLAALSAYTGVANTPMSVAVHKSFISGTVSPITISGRIGSSAAGTTYVNRGNTETFGGGLTSSYIIMELT